MDQKELDQYWQELADRNGVLDEAQFTSADVCKIAGINAKQLEHAVDPARWILNLTTHSGTRRNGKRRLFRGSDALKIKAMFVASAIGFPQRFAKLFADQVELHARNLLIGLTKPGWIWITYPTPNGDWQRVPIHESQTEPPHKLPLAYHIIEVDRLINETIEQLNAIAKDEEMPDFNVTPPPHVHPFGSPEDDPLKQWEKDEAGKDTLIGLTHVETNEIKNIGADFAAYDSEVGRARYEELLTKAANEWNRRRGYFNAPLPDGDE